jgi:hypothetical protein
MTECSGNASLLLIGFGVVNALRESRFALDEFKITYLVSG